MFTHIFSINHEFYLWNIKNNCYKLPYIYYQHLPIRIQKFQSILKIVVNGNNTYRIDSSNMWIEIYSNNL